MKTKHVISIAFVSLGITILLLALHTIVSYDYALETGAAIYGDSVNGFLVRCYLAICFWVIAFVVGRSFKKEIASQAMCVCALIAVILSYRLVYHEKTLVLAHTETSSFFWQLSATIDIVNFFLVLVLVVAQAFSLYRALKHSRDRALL